MAVDNLCKSCENPGKKQAGENKKEKKLSFCLPVKEP
jgi:hypothetical protein